jgi:8-oxo-dGTP diphosphatase
MTKRRGEVVLVICRPNGLIILHTKRFYPAGVYRLPSGGIRRGERVLEAMWRETQEETGLEVEIERFLGLLEYEFHHRDERLPFVSYVFLGRERGGYLAPQDESEQITAFRAVAVDELATVAEALRALPDPWRDWGAFRALAHDFVAERSLALT